MALQTCIEDVEKFMVSCGQETAVGLVHPQTDLYLKLISEEFGEFVDGVKENSMIDILDGAIDTIWVVCGYLISRYGNEGNLIFNVDKHSDLTAVVTSSSAFASVINPVNPLVPKSVVYASAVNFCTDLAQYCVLNGMAVVSAWKEVRRSNMSKLDPVTGKAIKREDGKIMKPASYSPPDLTGFVLI